MTMKGMTTEKRNNKIVLNSIQRALDKASVISGAEYPLEKYRNHILDVADRYMQSKKRKTGKKCITEATRSIFTYIKLWYPEIVFDGHQNNVHTTDNKEVTEIMEMDEMCQHRAKMMKNAIKAHSGLDDQQMELIECLLHLIKHKHSYFINKLVACAFFVIEYFDEKQWKFKEIIPEEFRFDSMGPLCILMNIRKSTAIGVFKGLLKTIEEIDNWQLLLLTQMKGPMGTTITKQGDDCHKIFIHTDD